MAGLRSNSSTLTVAGGCHGRPARGGGVAASARRARSGFDAVVVGEYERAFCGDQVLTFMPIFEEHNVQLWLPEAHGPVSPAEPAHQALLMLLAAQSKREMLRARSRALTAMRAQIRDEGRFLGGRPLNRYRLVDAGPAPEPDAREVGSAVAVL